MDKYTKLSGAVENVLVTNEKFKSIDVADAYSEVIREMRFCSRKGGTVWFIGNGGSASIASHMAEDYTKNGNVRSMAFNDASLLTCFANDYGHEWMFAKLIEKYAKPNDILIAISSSGESLNITNAADVANQRELLVYTLSGFSSDNLLRSIGDLNFYTPTKKPDYGITEITHLTILHTILDLICEGK